MVVPQTAAAPKRGKRAGLGNTRGAGEHSRGGGLADEVGDLLGELVGAAHHHAVQRGWVLRDVDADGPHLHHGRVVGLQSPLGAVQGL